MPPVESVMLGCIGLGPSPCSFLVTPGFFASRTGGSQDPPAAIGQGVAGLLILE